MKQDQSGEIDACIAMDKTGVAFGVFKINPQEVLECGRVSLSDGKTAFNIVKDLLRKYPPAYFVLNDIFVDGSFHNASPEQREALMSLYWSVIGECKLRGIEVYVFDHEDGLDSPKEAAELEIA